MQPRKFARSLNLTVFACRFACCALTRSSTENADRANVRGHSHHTFMQPAQLCAADSLHAFRDRFLPSTRHLGMLDDFAEVWPVNSGEKMWRLACRMAVILCSA